jgi:hypothetical protein
MVMCFSAGLHVCVCVCFKSRVLITMYNPNMCPVFYAMICYTHNTIKPVDKVNVRDYVHLLPIVACGNFI